MLYPHVHCNDAGDVCHATAGEGEINAAASMMALVLSDRFDLRKTYFLFTGIAGVNPKLATLGGVALARYTVQVALQYEIDARSLPDRREREEKHVQDKGDWPSGYFGFGTDFPLEYPSITYGSEVFELNDALRKLAYEWSAGANLSDADEPRSYRQLYNLPVSTDIDEGQEGEEQNPFLAAVGPPKVVLCDAATSDVYYSGTLLAETFENTTRVWTNGTGQYCMTAQEDNANLEVMVRAAIEGLVDFSRIIVMRTGKLPKKVARSVYMARVVCQVRSCVLMRPGSNFDRPPPGMSDWEHLALSDQNGFDIALENIYRVGMPIVRGILDSWDCEGLKDGVETENYVGDIFGSLGGDPDFGLGSITDGKPVAAGGEDSVLERGMSRRARRGRRGLMK